jgi:DNA-binding NarL/FixJ family response regulator
MTILWDGLFASLCLRRVGIGWLGDAELALRTFQDEPVRLVILDYFLAGITGTELARQMRQLKEDVPMLLLSGSNDLPEGTEYVDARLSKLEPVAVIEAKIAGLLANRMPGRIGPQQIDVRNGAPKSKRS